MVGHWLSRQCVGRESMSVYEPLRDVVTAVHENCSMGCDQRCAGGVGAYEVERKIYKGCYVR